jgi:phosphoribosylformylglycinamidine cyclo-ligase
MDYRQSGVDIDAGTDVVRRIRAMARRTFTPGVLSDLGGFGGLFQLDRSRHREPVLVASADGVGTKLKLAFMTGIHTTIGQDLVNHCVNDILVQGADPLFFLDYLATGRLSPDVAADVISGVARACEENGCALIGGETAEMPGFYADGEYDLAGFVVGVVERDRVVDGRTIAPGDALIGLRSTGLHTNGYSLARKIAFERLALRPEAVVPEFGESIAAALLKVHRSYLGAVRPLLDARMVKGMAHITGGGITENVPRMLPDGLRAVVDTAAWTPPPIFGFLARHGAVARDELFRAFNMGVGLVIACAPGDIDEVRRLLHAASEPDAVVVGRVEEGDRGVRYV